MELGRETHRPLGVVLVEQGLVTGDDIDGALAAQVETSEPLGQILLQRALIARPMLAKALAAQRGRSLEEEGGFGSGLMAKIEQLHLLRRGLQDEKLREGVQDAPVRAAEIGERLMWEEPEDRQLELLRQRGEELDARERELQQQEARLARRERKLKGKAADAAPMTPAA